MQGNVHDCICRVTGNIDDLQVKKNIFFKVLNPTQTFAIGYFITLFEQIFMVQALPCLLSFFLPIWIIYSTFKDQCGACGVYFWLYKHIHCGAKQPSSNKFDQKAVKQIIYDDQQKSAEFGKRIDFMQFYRGTKH